MRRAPLLSPLVVGVIIGCDGSAPGEPPPRASVRVTSIRACETALRAVTVSANGSAPIGAVIKKV